MDYFSRNKYTLCVLAIIILAIALRFVQYQERYGLAYDQAHDAIIAKYAVDHWQLPLLGPFSSAGPYQTGGEWYWLLMLGTIILPFSTLSPWIFLTALGVLFVVGIIRVGLELVNRKFGLMVGMLAAVSTAQITQSTNLTNQTPLAIVALGGIWCSMRFIRLREIRYIFWLGFFVGFGASIHLQGVALGLLLLYTLIFARYYRWQVFVAASCGLVIPWIPVFIVDFNHHFFNSRNMLQYYLHDQYAISLDALGRRWTTYAGVFWPSMWGLIIGGTYQVGFVQILALGMVGVYGALKKTISREFWVFIFSAVSIVVLLRYTRTPLFESYLVFFHPFAMLLTAWVIYFVYEQKKIAGVVLLGLLVFTSLLRDTKEINLASNQTGLFASAVKQQLLITYPKKTFAVYEQSGKAKYKSLPVVLFLQSHLGSSATSIRVGLVATDAAYIREPILLGKKDEVKLVTLQEYSEGELQKRGWNILTPEAIYNATEAWYKQK